MGKQENMLPRGAFLSQAGLLTAALAAPVAAAAATKTHPGVGITQVRGLQTLLDGNARFVADASLCPPHSRERMQLAEEQNPFAVVLSCSDSRVPVEIIFDQAPGAIFGVRLAGNFLDENGAGSIEYAIAALKSSLVLVLGHSQCGAVKAAVEFVKDGTTQPGNIQSIVTALATAAKNTKGSAGNWVQNAIEQNVRDSVAALTQRSTIIADAVKSGKVRLAGAVYDLHTGIVSIVH